MGVVLVIALGVVLVILVAVAGYYARKRRILLWQQTAAGLGLQYSTEDPFGLVDMPFDLFSRGDRRGTENVLWGTKDGLDVKAFEFWDYTESSDTKGNRSRSYEHFSCALLPAPVMCPHTSIAPESFFSRIGRALGFHDIEFESEEFNKAMKVKSAEPKFATYLVDPRMMEWLLANKGWQFELSGQSLLTYCKRVKPPEIANVIAAARGFHQHIPRVIDETFKEGS
jgi:hypothetical protein